MKEKEGVRILNSSAVRQRSRPAGAAVASQLDGYAQQLVCGADVATVLDDVIAYALKARARIEVPA